MSRPGQIGIDRLPARRMSTEPRESMNCKSCRKRKIKCNRLRPTCEACQVFACPCVYDAVPKKRGPKTDVLEALLKRVDGLEKRLRTEDGPDSQSPTSPTTEAIINVLASTEGSPPTILRAQPEVASNGNNVGGANGASSVLPSSDVHSAPSSPQYPEVLLDTYFSRIHGKPHYILDEGSTRQRLRNNQLPIHLAYALYAVSARYASQYSSYNAVVQAGCEYARRARLELDIDEPSIEALQTLVLLSQAMFQAGRGKKAYMYLASAISMIFALGLHRELPSSLRIASAEREGRRRLFWTCYLMDRFAACGSKRPSLISDECIVLRMPSFPLKSGTLTSDGDYFPSGFNLQYNPANGKPVQGSTGMLIGITRILGITNRYLAAGGVKGDPHFPWHSLSNLSKIRQDLDIWASETQDTFSSLESLFGQPDSSILMLSKLIYHLIHCLIYRPFLPIDLAELSGTSQHQSWQIEATNLCFLHANAIAELVQVGSSSPGLDWPAFVGYCVCTAGTIHVHGAHFRGRDGEVFSASADFLSRELQQLRELRYPWTGVQHQNDTLQTLYGAHSELVKSLASNPARFSPVFHLEDFFDRYPRHVFDGAHFTFSEIVLDERPVTSLGSNTPSDRFNLPSQQVNGSSHFYQSTNHAPAYNGQSYYPLQTINAVPSTPHQPPLRRRATVPTKISPSSSGLGPGKFNGVSSSDTYQSPYISSSAFQGQQGNTYNSTLKLTSPGTYNQSAETAGAQDIDGSNHTDDLDVNTYDPMFTMPAQFEHDNDEAELHHKQPYQYLNQSQIEDTPDPPSINGLAQADADADPFLSLLEQLAENEQNRGGPSELDLFLSGG